MSGYIVHILLALLCVLFWRTRAGRSLDQLIDDGHHHHHQVLAVMKDRPMGGDWVEYSRWMAEGEKH